MRRAFRLLNKPYDVFPRHARAFSASLPNSQGRGSYYTHMASQLTRSNTELRVKLMNDIKTALKVRRIQMLAVVILCGCTNRRDSPKIL
jgi:hypothetical protein